MSETAYTPRERLVLTGVALVGVLGLNGAFFWALVFDPNALRETLTNPMSAAVVVEACVLVGVLAYLLRKWGVARLGWGWFVLLAFLGGLAFALPVVLLWGPRRSRREERT